MGAARHIGTLSTVVVVLLYVCMWSSAREGAGVWLDSIGADETITAGMVAHRVISVLFVTWPWLLLLMGVFLMAEATLMRDLRAKHNVSRYGTVFDICFNVLGRTRVWVALASSIMLTYVFAWVAAKRAMSGKEDHGRMVLAVRDAVSNAMTFNLVTVVVAVLLSRPGS